MRELAQQLQDSKSFEYIARDFAKAWSKKRGDEDEKLHYLEKFLEIVAPKLSKVTPEQLRKNRTPPPGTVIPQLPAAVIDADSPALKKEEIEKFREEVRELRERETTDEFQARFVKEFLIPALKDPAQRSLYYRVEDGFKIITVPSEWEERALPSDNWEEALKKLRLGKLHQCRVNVGVVPGGDASTQLTSFYFV